MDNPVTQTRDPTMPLIHVAERLQSPDIDRIVRPFREPKASLRRAILLSIALSWSWFWGTQSPQHFLNAEAVSILPALVIALVIALGWSFYVNRLRHHLPPWVDVVGTILDFAVAFYLLKNAWNLLLPIVGFLPLACVNTGARFKPVWFYISVAVAVLIVGLSAPSGYWASRPAVAILAMVLVAGIPLTFNRVLLGLSRISEKAISARDSQSRFLAMMSHELRTPLHTVINAASLVSAYPHEYQRVPLLNSIKTNANVLLSRVNDMLDVAASSASGPTTDPGEAFDLRSVIHTVKAVIHEQALERRLMLTFMFDAARPTTLIGHPRKLEQVIINLASNAIKYTPPGGSIVITAAASPVVQGAEESELVISVADTGIGIPDAEKDRIFDAFHQVSSGETRQFDGVGLGLHIVKQLSIRLSASISVEDNPGGGTVFTWRQTLPVAHRGAVLSSDQAASTLLAEHAASTPSMRCLVIDDNASNRQIIGRILTLAGHQFSYATDGPQGIAMIISGDYDVAFLDLHMPGMSGLDVLEAVHGQAYGMPLPKIVILTASTDAKAQERAKQLHAYGFLFKPLAIADLLSTLSGIAAGITFDHESLRGAGNPIDMMRSLSDDSTTRAFIHHCANDLRDCFNAVIQASPEESDEHRAKLLHGLKNALINTGMPLDTITADGPIDQPLTHAELQDLLPRLHRLVASANAFLATAPEMA